MNIQFFLDLLDGNGLVITDWELLDETLKHLFDVTLEDGTEKLQSEE
jgi:hypothetical protein